MLCCRCFARNNSEGTLNIMKKNQTLSLGLISACEGKNDITRCQIAGELVEIVSRENKWVMKMRVSVQKFVKL